MCSFAAWFFWGAWGLWFALARVQLVETSRSARLEVVQAAFNLDAPASGRVVANHLRLGQAVKKGDLLFEMDARAVRLELQAEENRQVAIASQMAALERQLAAGLVASKADEAAADAAVRQAGARQKAAEALARLKREEQARMEALEQGNIAELEVLRSRAEAKRQAAEVSALAQERQRMQREKRMRQSDRQAEQARMQKELQRLQTEKDLAGAKAALFREELSRRQVLAPVDGRIGDSITLQAGAYIQEGAHLALLVPDGDLHVVAHFDPANAVGRVRPGQQAQVRLDGFPWTQYGQLQAKVGRVGNDPLSGMVRVELTLLNTSETTIPLQHGLPGQVDVTVGKLSPSGFVLDVAGRYLQTAGR